MIFQTERLFLRKMEAVDFQDLAEILQDPQVMYAYGHDFTDEDVLHWLDRQKTRYLKYGFGLWALVLKETGEMIGQAPLEGISGGIRRITRLSMICSGLSRTTSNFTSWL